MASLINPHAKQSAAPEVAAHLNAVRSWLFVVAAFVFAMVALIALLIVVPDVALWLPRYFKGSG